MSDIRIDHFFRKKKGLSKEEIKKKLVEDDIISVLRLPDQQGRERELTYCYKTGVLNFSPMDWEMKDPAENFADNVNGFLDFFCKEHNLVRDPKLLNFEIENYLLDLILKEDGVGEAT